MNKTLTKSRKESRTFLNDEHIMFRDSLRKFVEKEIDPYFTQWEEDRIVPRELWTKLGSQGFLCPSVEEKYGGTGLDFIFDVVLSEELSKVGGGLSGIGLHSNVVTPYITSFGTEEQKMKYLPKFVSGEWISAIAMTEPGAGSDLQKITTTAIKDGSDYIVNGTKTFITNGILSDVIIIACKTDPKAVPAHNGVSLMIIERGMEGFSRGRKLDKVGMHSQDTAELIFENVRVPAENLLGEEGKGFLYLMQKLQQERLLTAVGAITAAKDMLDLTLQYVKEREAFGKPIGKFQNTQFVLAEIATQVQIGQTFVDDLIVRHLDGQDIVTEVSMAKWWVTDMARKISAECMQLHGGYGYMEEYKIARRFRDIAVTPIFAGSNEIMKVIIAKNMGL
ncbi:MULTISPECIES: acyl-CoA dehydrogenase family protein [Solibacillus]|uniref:Acyl-CoA dehydrogenase family protein n=1 Tax=Solibacillus merdavium TaxID=2762218 RepID=A0ABR8XKA5_9BACL|nr:acyl-CoA dehydrogenase family protein [Solibacillus merdavium]MBD8032347.1 acyl-CoA dehydrogenase family protein [Solibacillus merdavium]